MKALWVLVALLALVAGCVGLDGENWATEAMRDWNGDRMKMSGESINPYSPKAGDGSR